MSSTPITVAKPSDYLDFQLEVTSGTSGQYPAVITRSPAGQAQTALRLTCQAAEPAQLVQQATERVAALQTEAHRLTKAAKANWARARLATFCWGPPGEQRYWPSSPWY